MKIVSSSIQFKTEYRQRTSEEKQSGLSFSRQASGVPGDSRFTATSERLQAEQRARLSSTQTRNTYSASQIRKEGDKAVQQFSNQKLVSSMLERFYSHSVRINHQQISATDRLSSADRQAVTGNSRTELAIGSYYELSRQQELTFVAEGEIKTADGRTINFHFYASAEHDFRYQEASGAYAEKVVRRTDPLVIHLEGDFNHLSSSAFQFDLNNDGEKESISFAGSGSGFLALDKNNDGVINNGSELFGTRTGNGFEELGTYDEDGNGFIDAGDSAYEQLKAWTKDTDGNDVLTSLQDAGVAAISTQSGYTPFSVTDHYNNEYGKVQSSGIFVRESGEVGSVQQIDLTARDTSTEDDLARKFDRGEQVAVLERETEARNRERPDEPPSLREALKRLEQETQSMLERQDELAKMNDEDGPKSFLAQLVEKLEEVRQEQAARRKEEKAEKEQQGQPS